MKAAPGSRLEALGRTSVTRNGEATTLTSGTQARQADTRIGNVGNGPSSTNGVEAVYESPVGDRARPSRLLEWAHRNRPTRRITRRAGVCHLRRRFESANDRYASSKKD